MIKFAYFGSSIFSVYVLEELERAGLMPAVIITTPDKPAGRRLELTPTPVKTWALRKGIKFYEPAKLDLSFADALKREGCDLFIVASYGKIIPGFVINIPPRKILNVHPSLLPLFRGASPLQSSMTADAKRTGVTIMRMDEQVDHGPIIAQKEVEVAEWPTYEEFEEMMARVGGRLLAEILPDWVAGKLPEREQDHAKATFTKKIIKEDGLIELSADPYLNFRKIQACHEWPQAYFYADRNGRRIRLKIVWASWKNGALTIERVVPEGGREMDYSDFLRGSRV